MAAAGGDGKANPAPGDEINMLAEFDRVLSEVAGEGRGLHVLVTGRTGAGKSALVNSIVGSVVAKEGQSPEPETTEVTSYKAEVKGIVITIYDSPGLQDGVKNDDEYVQKLCTACKEVDLILYCVKMNDRIGESEYNAIKKLSSAFGNEKFWQNALFVLTFANEIKPPPAHCNNPNTVRSPQEDFKDKLSKWKAILHQEALIKRAHIAEPEARNVPIVPAGYYDNLSLPASNCEYWLSRLWWKCLYRAEDSGKRILFDLNQKRLQRSSNVSEKDASALPGHKQPIVADIGDLNKLTSALSHRG